MKLTALLLSLALFGSWPRIAFADPPPAEFEISFDGDAAIWNPFEGFEACETVSDVTTCMSLENVVCDGAGRCTGEADVELSGALSGSGSAVFRGIVRCVATPDPNDPICRARLEIEELIGSGDPCDFELVDFRLRGRVDPTGIYRARAATDLCLSCPGAPRQCSPATGRFAYAVNPPTAWTLEVHSEPIARDPLLLRGEAFDSLGFTYRVFGEQSVGNGVTSFVLRGDRDRDTQSAGARIKLRNLVFDGEDLQAGTAQIRVQGNKIRDKLGH